MNADDLAGKPAPQSLLENIPRLIAAYYTNQPDATEISQQVAFGTSGHRGTMPISGGVKVMTQNGWFAARP